MLTINKNQTFKTIQIVFWYSEVLDEKTIPYRFLLGKLLRYYTDKEQTPQKLNERFSELYGARISDGIKIFKGRHYLYYVITIVDPTIVSEKKLLEEVINLYKEIVYDRKLFLSKNVNLVKKQILDLIEKRKEDKSELAKLDYYDKIFGDHPYGKDLIGKKEDILSITKEDLYDYYIDSFLKNPLSITINGNISDEDALYIEDEFSDLIVTDETNKMVRSFSFDKEISLHEKYTQMNQALIYIGYFSDITYDSDLYEAMLLTYILLGSSPDSRLFKIIREELMLGYEVDTEYDIDRQLLTMYAGVELSKKDLAQEKMLDIMENLITYGPTETELISAKKYLKSMMYTSLDYQLTQSFRAFLELHLTTHLSLDKRIKRVENVTQSDIKEVLSGLKLAGIYILHGDLDDE